MWCVNAYYYHSKLIVKIKAIISYDVKKNHTLHALEKEMATHSSVLAWKIPWTQEPGGLQSLGLQRVGHD